MEYRWSILGGKGEEQETCFGGKKSLVLYQKRLIVKYRKRHIFLDVL
jgi:hypothetical protein